MKPCPQPRSGTPLGSARFTIAALILLATAWLTPVGAQTAPAPTFAQLVERLSEEAGDFPGDNLISNEQSYLHVMPALQRAGTSGGAFVGVGPDQNFSYIAQIKPAIAYIIDIRRDNLLLHLLFKALFSEAPSRAAYLSLLTGRPVPERSELWADRTIEAIIAYIDATKPQSDEEQERLQLRLETVIKNFGVPLSAADLETIAKVRARFVSAGLNLVFQARGQPLRNYYPSLRTLLREKDRDGRQLSFLALEPAYRFVRSMQARDLIIPVVGDVSGSRAMRAIAADMKARALTVSAFYISNIEYYLFPPGTFARYAANLNSFPHDQQSMVIRSVFPSGGSRTLPQAMNGFYSTSLVQPLEAMLADLEAGKYRTYRDLVLATSRSDLELGQLATREAVPLSR